MINFARGRRFGARCGMTIAPGLALLSGFFVAAPLLADPIVSEAGNVSGGVGLFNHGTFAQTFMVSWTQANLSTDVAISATIGWPQGTFPVPPLSGTAILTNHIGPGTTAANEIASASFTAPSDTFTDENLFLGLSLTGGTYYLILSANGANNPVWADTISNSPGSSLTTGQDVSFNGFFISGDTNADPALDTFVPDTRALLFSVSGTAAVPESSTWLVCIPVSAALGALGVKQRRNSRRHAPAARVATRL